MDRAAELSVMRGWTWHDPIKVSWGRRCFFGRVRWTVISNSESRGCNVRVVIDDTTGQIVEAGFNPR